mmetsp:Transcript_105292/g.241432  ORF Transcript_105292/g.241432 Transcript_105292/m.241432 type:complete len:578 (+) Transcript_105292:53-1786(+)
MPGEEDESYDDLQVELRKLRESAQVYLGGKQFNGTPRSASKRDVTPPHSSSSLPAGQTQPSRPTSSRELGGSSSLEQRVADLERRLTAAQPAVPSNVSELVKTEVSNLLPSLVETLKKSVGASKGSANFDALQQEIEGIAQDTKDSEVRLRREFSELQARTDMIQQDVRGSQGSKAAQDGDLRQVVADLKIQVKGVATGAATEVADLRGLLESLASQMDGQASEMARQVTTLQTTVSSLSRQVSERRPVANGNVQAAPASPELFSAVDSLREMLNEQSARLNMELTQIREQTQNIVSELRSEFGAWQQRTSDFASDTRQELTGLHDELNAYAGLVEGAAAVQDTLQQASQSLAQVQTEVAAREADATRLDVAINETRQTLVHGLKEAWKEIQATKADLRARTSELATPEAKPSKPSSQALVAPSRVGDDAQGEEVSLAQVAQQMEDVRKQVVRMYQWVSEHVSAQGEALRQELDAKLRVMVLENKRPAGGETPSRSLKDGRAGSTSSLAVEDVPTAAVRGASPRTAAARPARKQPAAQSRTGSAARGSVAAGRDTGQSPVSRRFSGVLQRGGRKPGL